MNFGNKLKLAAGLLTFISILSVLQADAVSPLTSELCSIVGAVQTIVGILALTLFLIGGVLYAVSHFLPTNLEFKKSLTAWSQGMIVGGVIGLIIVLIAPPLIQLIMGVGTASGGSVGSLSCT
jgi:hypothetical protein